MPGSKQRNYPFHLISSYSWLNSLLGTHCPPLSKPIETFREEEAGEGEESWGGTHLFSLQSIIMWKAMPFVSRSRASHFLTFQAQSWCTLVSILGGHAFRMPMGWNLDCFPGSVAGWRSTVGSRFCWTYWWVLIPLTTALVWVALLERDSEALFLEQFWSFLDGWSQKVLLRLPVQCLHLWGPSRFCSVPITGGSWSQEQNECAFC